MTTDTQKLLEVYVGSLQGLEDAFFELLDILSIDDTEGVGLDKIGALIGCGRQDDIDSRYRIRLKAQVRVNASHGTPQNIVDIVRLLVDDADLTIAVVVGNDAEFQITIGNGFMLNKVGRQIEVAVEQAKVAGVRSVVIWQDDTEAYFGFFEDPSPHRFGFGLGPFVFPG